MVKKICTDDVAALLWKIAESGIGDIVELILMEPEEAREKAGKLEFLMVSEIRRGSGGNLEIKLMDRLAVLRLLAELCREGPGEGAAADILRALDKKAGSGG